MAKQVPARNGGTLTRPDKGETMNPKGRPKGSLNAKTTLQKFLSGIDLKGINPVTGEKEKLSYYEKMHLTAIQKALDGDYYAYREILDRMEGKAQQKIDHTTGGDKIDNKFEIEIITKPDASSSKED